MSDIFKGLARTVAIAGAIVGAILLLDGPSSSSSSSKKKDDDDEFDDGMFDAMFGNGRQSNDAGYNAAYNIWSHDD